MRTGKIKIIAFQGETDFAGGEKRCGARGEKGQKKTKKQKARRGERIGSSRRGDTIHLPFSSWGKEPSSLPRFLKCSMFSCGFSNKLSLSFK